MDRDFWEALKRGQDVSPCTVKGKLEISIGGWLYTFSGWFLPVVIVATPRLWKDDTTQIFSGWNLWKRAWAMYYARQLTKSKVTSK